MDRRIELTVTNSAVPEASTEALSRQVAADDFCFVPAERLRACLEAQAGDALDDWSQFQSSWNDMPRDAYMADGGIYRRRRHATLSALASSRHASLEPHQQPVAKQQLNTDAHLNGVKPCRTSPFGNGTVRRGAWSTFASDN